MLEPGDIDAIAAKTAALLAESESLPTVFTASELADYLGVGKDVVYANRARLGGVKLGDGPRARLRFLIDQIELDRWRERKPSAPKPAVPKPPAEVPVRLLRLKPETSAEK